MVPWKMVRFEFLKATNMDVVLLETVGSSETSVRLDCIVQNIRIYLDNDLMVNVCYDLCEADFKIRVHTREETDKGQTIEGHILIIVQCNTTGNYRPKNKNSNTS